MLSQRKGVYQILYQQNFPNLLQTQQCFQKKKKKIGLIRHILRELTKGPSNETFLNPHSNNTS